MKLLTNLALFGVAAAAFSIAETAWAQRDPAQVAGLRLTPVSDAAITAPIRNAYGKVKSVVGDALTLDVGGRDMTFIIDDNTDVLARGAGRAMRKTSILSITGLLRSGDGARVAYRELDGALHASAISVSGRYMIASR